MAENDKHGGIMGIVDRMQDAVGGMVGMATAGTMGAMSTSAFVENAAIGNLYEVMAGRIAQRRGTSDPLRTFAAMMIDDHLAATHHLRSALRTNEVRNQHPSLSLPTELDARRSGMIDRLERAADADFDARYIEQQKMAHAETLTLLKGYASHGDNPQLQSVARGAIPMVERHQASAERIDRH